MRYEVKKIGKYPKVWDNQSKVWITKKLPSMDIANEIADDFNKMENKDFTPLGLPDLSKCECKGTVLIRRDQATQIPYCFECKKVIEE